METINFRNAWVGHSRHFTPPPSFKGGSGTFGACGQLVGWVQPREEKQLSRSGSKQDMNGVGVGEYKLGLSWKNFKES